MKLSLLAFLVPAFLASLNFVSAESLELSIQDESGDPLPCRVLVRDAAGDFHVPHGTVTLLTGPELWFMSSGKSQLDVPSGEVLVRIERGCEYVRIKKLIQVSGATATTLQLKRWIHMQQRGYLCGENHLHVDTVQLAPMLVAEGLDFGSSLTWWRGPDQRRPIPAGQGPTRLLTFAGRVVPTSIFDAELEYSWGAAYIQNLPEPLPLDADPGRPNLDYLQHSVEAGAIVHYQGGWSREVLMNALLGCVHTVNVCNNNFALQRFQPRSVYSNLLNVEGFPEYADTDVGMLQMNTDTYYRLLNCGLQLAAGAGSATGVKRAPVGYNRAYVRVPEGSSIDEFYAAWKAGRNFVTNGPMLLLRTGAGQRPGDIVNLTQDNRNVSVHVEVFSDQPLTSVEIIANGRVIGTVEINDPLHVVGTLETNLGESTWLAARCTARDELLTEEDLNVLRVEAEQLSQRVSPSRLRFAHTSPVYFTLDGLPATDPTSLDEGLQMLDQLEVFNQETAAPQYKPIITAAIARARGILLSRRP